MKTHFLCWGRTHQWSVVRVTWPWDFLERPDQHGTYQIPSISYSPEDSPPVRNVRCKQIHQCPRYPVTAQGLPKNYGSLAVNISSSKCDKVVVCQHMWSKGLMRWWAWRGWCALGSNGRAMTEMTSGAASRGGQARGNFPVLGLPLPRLMLAHHPGPPNHLPNLWLLWMLSSEWGFLFPLLLKKLSVK